MEQICRRLKEHGIDTDGVIARLGGNEKKYISICLKFLYDTSYQSIHNAVDKDEYSDAQLHIHTLKGVSANLGFIYLSSLCNRLLTLLQYPKDLTAFRKDLIRLNQEYAIIISILNENSLC